MKKKVDKITIIKAVLNAIVSTILLIVIISFFTLLIWVTINYWNTPPNECPDWVNIIMRGKI